MFPKRPRKHVSGSSPLSLCVRHFGGLLKSESTVSQITQSWHLSLYQKIPFISNVCILVVRIRKQSKTAKSPNHYFNGLLKKPQTTVANKVFAKTVQVL
jgi:hypothetical protein